MAQSKKNQKGRTGVYVLHRDYIFRSRRHGKEADLPQPVNGEARCYIVAADYDMDPIPYRTPDDIRLVIGKEIAGSGWRLYGEDIDALVEYYQGSFEDFYGVVAELNSSIAAIERRGSAVGIEALALALA